MPLIFKKEIKTQEGGEIQINVYEDLLKNETIVYGYILNPKKTSPLNTYITKYVPLMGTDLDYERYIVPSIELIKFKIEEELKI